MSILRIQKRLFFVSLAVLLCVSSTLVHAQPPGPGTSTFDPVALANMRKAELERAKNRNRELAQLVEEYQSKLDDRRRQLQKMRLEIQNSCGLSPENVLAVLLESERESFALEGSLELRKFRLDLISKTFAEKANEAKKLKETDEVASLLAKVVDAKAAAVEDARRAVKMNVATPSEVVKAQADLAEAQIRIVLRQEELAKKQKDLWLEKAGQQSAELAIELSQDQFRQKYLKERLNTLSKARDLVDEYNRMKDFEIAKISRSLEEAENSLQQAKLELSRASAP